jgi:ABC-type phosphate/phosphonate transport system substrate-binding protein
MKNMKLPNNIQEKVQKFIVSTHSTLDTQNELQSFFEMISPSLKIEVNIFIYSSILQDHPIMKKDKLVIEFVT